MKSYVKPSIEIISMKTSENIANNLIKTIYTKSGNGDTYTNTEKTVATWNAAQDLPDSAQNA